MSPPIHSRKSRGAGKTRKRIVIAALSACLLCASHIVSQDIGSDLFGGGPTAPPATTKPAGESGLGSFTAEPRSSGNDILMETCTIVPAADYTLAAEQAGRLMMGPELGAEIKEDELVAKTDDTIAQHQHRIAYFVYQAEKTKTESDIEQRYAEKQAQVKEAGFQNAQAANSKVKNAVTPEVIREKKFAWEGALLGIQKAKHDMTVTRAGAEAKFAEYEAAESMVARHEVKSPVTGIVQEVFRRKGEWVNPGDPIAKVVRMDRLRVQGYLNISDCPPGKAKGATVTIEIPTARDEDGKPTAFAKIKSKIMHVDLEVTTKDDYGVWAEFPNTPEMDYWPATPDVSMRLELK